jgi:hypothetical protein
MHKHCELNDYYWNGTNTSWRNLPKYRILQQYIRRYIHSDLWNASILLKYLLLKTKI